MAINMYLSIILLNVNVLNSPFKRHRVAEWIGKQDPYIYAVYKRPTSERKTHRLKVKGWKKIFHSNRKGKKPGVAIFISDKIEFKTKAIVKVK